jgi:O-acetylhomoserine (thiol)-lyase
MFNLFVSHSESNKNFILMLPVASSFCHYLPNISLKCILPLYFLKKWLTLNFGNYIYVYQMDQKKRSIETLCVQEGWKPKNGEPRVLPIYQSTTFKYDDSEQMARLFDLKDSGYFYTRLQNPTNDCVANKIAALEGGVAGMLTSSGQAANFYAIFNICEAGDHFVSAASIYGGTYNLFGVTMKKLGIEVTFVDQDAPAEEIAKAFRPNTKAVFAETITNPTLSVLDIEKFAKLAHSHGVPLVVDNTFATPYNCRPFEFGCDIRYAFHHQVYGRPCLYCRRLHRR